MPVVIGDASFGGEDLVFDMEESPGGVCCEVAAEEFGMVFVEGYECGDVGGDGCVF